jgi:hypothetical protein
LKDAENSTNFITDFLEQVNANPPPWAENILLPYEDIRESKLEDYVVYKYSCSNDSVNVQDVVGTAHPDYVNESWLWLLNNGKRMLEVLPQLAKTPSYYFETSKKEQIGFTEIDGKTYITGGGNHRTCIARFFFYYRGLTTLYGVYKEVYRIDHHFKSLFEALKDTLKRKKIDHSLRVVQETIERIDTASWSRDNYSLKAKLEIDRSGWQGHLTAPEIQEILIDSERPFNRYFGKYKGIWK